MVASLLLRHFPQPSNGGAHLHVSGRMDSIRVRLVNQFREKCHPPKKMCFGERGATYARMSDLISGRSYLPPLPARQRVFVMRATIEIFGSHYYDEYIRLLADAIIMYSTICRGMDEMELAHFFFSVADRHRTSPKTHTQFNCGRRSRVITSNYRIGGALALASKRRRNHWWW